MNHLLLMMGASLALVNLLPSDLDQNSEHWLSFKAEHNKTYESDKVESLRLAIFMNNKRHVERFNAEMGAEADFEVGLNHLADKSNLEVQSMNGFKLSGSHQLRNSAEADKFLNDILNDKSIEIPDEVDWRKVEGRVTRVKDQGFCGSCWAFATTGALEGQETVRPGNFSHKSDKAIELSEQNLVDCVPDDYGCGGGDVRDAFNFIQKQGGIDDEQSYPYQARALMCRFKKDNVVYSDKGYSALPVGDEQKLKEVVAKFGPVAVAIDASTTLFMFYKKGVYVNKKCKSGASDLNHAVLVVGYGTDKKGGDYWIVKNSWGDKWGEEGYIRMARNRDNMCGIATEATIPTF